MVDVNTSIELQEQLQAFIGGDRARIQEIRDVITGVDEREMTPGKTSEVGRLSVTLTERMAEVERSVQTRSASPATTVEQNPTIHEDIARLDSRI